MAKKINDPVVLTVCEILVRADPAGIGSTIRPTEYQSEAIEIIRQIRVKSDSNAGMICKTVFTEKFSWFKSDGDRAYDTCVEAFNDWIKLGDAIAWLVKNPEAFK